MLDKKSFVKMGESKKDKLKVRFEEELYELLLSSDEPPSATAKPNVKYCKKDLFENTPIFDCAPLSFEAPKPWKLVQRMISSPFKEDYKKFISYAKREFDRFENLDNNMEWLLHNRQNKFPFFYFKPNQEEENRKSLSKKVSKNTRRNNLMKRGEVSAISRQQKGRLSPGDSKMLKKPKYSSQRMMS